MDSIDYGRGAEVTSSTEIDVGTGLAGVIRRWMVTRLLQRVYAEKLALLAVVAAKR